MSTLTGNQIKNTYQGLLKLDDSSTGITQNLQAIQDGLGNNTGLRIATDQLEVPNIQSFVSLKGQYYGSGFQATATSQMAAGTQNVIIAAPFIDKGLYSFSALTYHLVSGTSTSDTCEAAIYTSQLINPNGLFPSEPIISGLTITTTGSTGQKTVVFPSNISMSGYGGGVYWVVFKVSNAGVQPTVRFGAGAVGVIGNIYGQIAAITTNTYTQSQRLSSGAWQVFSGQTTFDNPFGTDLASKQTLTSSINGSNLGILLHTVDA
jgi:hypothetical protein